MRSTIEIDGRRIGHGQPVYLVAEMSANHGGSLEHACRVLRAAAAAGADAIKIQTYTADTLTLDCQESPFRIGADSPWANRTLYELYQEAHTPWGWQAELKALADELGITLFSTPFDASAVEFLEELAVPAYKIASFELVDLGLIERVGRTGKPVILSTGLASLAEIGEAVDTVRSTGNEQLLLLKCTSAYPAEPGQMQLRTIPDLAERFEVPVGLSDHTLGTVVPLTSVALGASMIEKHFCLSREEGGPDSSFSMEPADLSRLVQEVRTAEAALGTVRYGPGESELESLLFRRSLFAVEDIEEGELLTTRSVRSIRPGHGLAPKHLEEVLGCRARTAIRRGTPLSWELVQRSHASSPDHP
ncbi:MAG: pseudaminic acid synthase [Planctomycetota bacterium]